MRSVYITLSALALGVANAWDYPDCEPDNCYREMIDQRFYAEAESFCPEFLSGITTAASAIPTDFSNCGGDVSAVSSACSCITYTMTATASSSTPTKLLTSTSESSATTIVISTPAYVPPFSTSESSTKTTPSTVPSSIILISTSESSAETSLPPSIFETSTKTTLITSTSFQSSSSSESLTDTPSSSIPSSTFASSLSKSSAGTILSSDSTSLPSTIPNSTIPSGTMPLTTQTFYSTETQTISSCAPTVTDCPYTTKPMITVITKEVSTTICPVTPTTSPTISSSSWGTLTVYSTETQTISSCAPTVTDCPYTEKPLTTIVSKPVSTTIFLITSSTSSPTIAPSPSSSSWGTLTVYSTETQTISSCAPTVTDCPYTKKPLTTIVSKPVSTTIYLITASTSSQFATTAPSPSSSSWGTSTIFSTETQTISSCASTITDCPYTTQPLTSIVSKPVSTTIYLITSPASSLTTPSPSTSILTFYRTSTQTISSCAPTITDCPYTSQPLTTIISKPFSTTIVLITPPAPTPITSTLFSTSVFTVSSCAPEVTDCPYGSVTTSIFLAPTPSSSPSTIGGITTLPGTVSGSGATSTSPGAMQVTAAAGRIVAGVEMVAAAAGFAAALL